MSAVLAAEAAPLLLLGSISGRIAGRLGARRTLLACDALWAPVVALIPVLHFAGALSFSLLLVLAFVLGVPWAAHHGAQSAIIPELLGEGVGVAKANAVFQTASRLTYFAGPAVGGLLLALVGAPTVLLIDAATFLVSFLIISASVPASIRPPAAGSSAQGSGWRRLRRDPLLRPILGAGVLSQGAFMAMQAAVPVLAFTEYARSETLAGVLLAAWGGGALTGGLAAYRLVDQLTPVRLMGGAWALQAAPLWLMAFAPEPSLAVAALALSGLGNGLRVPPQFQVITDRIPPSERTRTMTMLSAVVFSGGFLALLMAGPTLEILGTGATFAALAAAQTVAAGLVLRLWNAGGYPGRPAGRTVATQATAQEES